MRQKLQSTSTSKVPRILLSLFFLLLLGFFFVFFLFCSLMSLSQHLELCDFSSLQDYSVQITFFLFPKSLLMAFFFIFLCFYLFCFLHICLLLFIVSVYNVTLFFIHTFPLPEFSFQTNGCCRDALLIYLFNFLSNIKMLPYA